VPPALLSIKETAAHLGLHRATVYLLVGDGKLDAVKFGKRTLITMPSIKAFIATLPPAKIKQYNADLRTSGWRGRAKPKSAA
jgi:excisionase family DNA binding protein